VGDGLSEAVGEASTRLNYIIAINKITNPTTIASGINADIHSCELPEASVWRAETGIQASSP
jgi:hypothetical protein